MAKLISLTQGQFAIVDDEDFDYLNQWKWFAAWVKHIQRFYAHRSVNRKGKIITIRMHSLITGYRRTDHCDGNGLNNCRANLRKCTKRQNSRNKKVNSNNACGFKGVQLPYPGAASFRARIFVNGKSVNLGSYNSAQDAARAYDRAALKNFKGFARLNFPGETHGHYA